MKLFLFPAAMLFFVSAFSQTRVLDSLRYRVFEGDIKALEILGKYLNSKKTVTEYLGYHILKSKERDIAARYIIENCFFKNAAFLNEDSISSVDFFKFLSSNQIVFDEDIGYFVLKGEGPGITKYLLYKTTASVVDSINNEFSESKSPVMIESGADWSYTLHNPQCLLLLAQYFLKQRNKWNINDFREEMYINSFRYMAHIDLAVPDYDSSMNLIYYITSDLKRQNLYSYFYYHYKDYQWNDRLHYFVNTKEDLNDKNELLKLFEALQSKNDSIAFSAFSKIGESDTAEVARLSKEFSINSIDRNYQLPTFPYRFLPVIANMTAYYRKAGIPYKPSGEIKKALEALLHEDSFKKRYELEDILIKKATIDEIHIIEYFGLINEQNSSNTYSIGRILDKWYSKNWALVCSNKKQLGIYLKKAEQFDNLGIIGNCNKYLLKFQNASTAVLESVKQLRDSTQDTDIIKAADFVITHYRLPIKPILSPIKNWAGEKEYNIIDPAHKIMQIMKSKATKDKKENEIEKMSGLISYKQIGSVLKQLLQDTALDNFSKYEFLQSDFGFYLDNMERSTIDSFLTRYNDLSQKDLYLSNLSSLGIDIENQGSYNYGQIYDILKFDVVDAFVGGGGGKQDENVYQVIKLLELKFGTTLGFVNKKCSWQGTWGCDCAERAQYWMNYLVENKLVTPDKTEPVSISSNK